MRPAPLSRQVTADRMLITEATEAGTPTMNFDLTGAGIRIDGGLVPTW